MVHPHLPIQPQAYEKTSTIPVYRLSWLIIVMESQIATLTVLQG